jgi:hypothetical protein
MICRNTLNDVVGKWAAKSVVLAVLAESGKYDHTISLIVRRFVQKFDLDGYQITSLSDAIDKLFERLQVCSDELLDIDVGLRHRVRQDLLEQETINLLLDEPKFLLSENFDEFTLKIYQRYEFIRWKIYCYHQRRNPDSSEGIKELVVKLRRINENITQVYGG